MERRSQPVSSRARRRGISFVALGYVATTRFLVRSEGHDDGDRRSAVGVVGWQGVSACWGRSPESELPATPPPTSCRHAVSPSSPSGVTGGYEHAVRETTKRRGRIVGPIRRIHHAIGMSVGAVVRGRTCLAVGGRGVTTLGAAIGEVVAGITVFGADLGTGRARPGAIALMDGATALPATADVWGGTVTPRSAVLARLHRALTGGRGAALADRAHRWADRHTATALPHRGYAEGTAERPTEDGSEGAPAGASARQGAGQGIEVSSVHCGTFGEHERTTVVCWPF